MNAWVSKQLLYRPVQFLRREPVLRHLRDLEQSQWLTREQLATGQAARLRDLVRHAARNVPHYREAFHEAGVDPAAIRSLSDLARLPVLEKSMTRTAGWRLVDETSRSRFDHRRTSGSTGVPLTILKSREATARIRAIWYRYLGWYGIDIGSRQGRFFGHPVDRLGQVRERVQDFILNKHRLDPVHFTSESMAAHWRAMLVEPPDHFYGYPSAMETFGRFLISGGEDPRTLGVRALVCTGETLYPHQAQFLTETFGARVINEYGCTESGILAFPCPEQGRFHVSADNVILEVLVGDRPAEPGERGEVVVTELHSPDAPLIRYRVGDLVVWGDDRACPCGRGLPTIESVEGRTSQMIPLPDGRQVHSEVFSYLSDAFSGLEPGIRTFRVCQRGARAFVLQLVAGFELARATRSAIHELAARVLGPDVTIDVEQVEGLPRDPSGKLSYFVREADPTPVLEASA